MWGNLKYLPAVAAPKLSPKRKDAPRRAALVAKVLIILSFPSKDDSANSIKAWLTSTNMNENQVECYSSSLSLRVSVFIMLKSRVNIQEEIHEFAECHCHACLMKF